MDFARQSSLIVKTAHRVSAPAEPRCKHVEIGDGLDKRVVRRAQLETFLCVPLHRHQPPKLQDAWIADPAVQQIPDHSIGSLWPGGADEQTEDTEPFIREYVTQNANKGELPSRIAEQVQASIKQSNVS